MPTLPYPPSSDEVVAIEDRFAHAISALDTVVIGLESRAELQEYGDNALTEAEYGRLAFVAADARHVAATISKQAEKIEELAYAVFCNERAA
jgi:hypothetical protein